MVSHLGRAWRLAALLEALPPDPEAESRAAAFFERMGIKRRRRAQRASAFK